MKIDRVVLKNFRQFYGEQSLELSTDPAKNVTLVHAENGVGKTTVLNSILWALFGDVTTKFEQRDKLINFEALAEKRTTTSVSVQFSFDESVYKVLRSYGLSGGRSEERFVAFRISDGASKAVDAPETFVNSVIPREMARYFFFDGEAAESFSGESNYKVVGRAIRNMLGCDLAECALEDLKLARKGVDDQMRDLPEEDELKRLESQLAEVESDLAKSTKAKDQFEEEIETFIAQREVVIQKLRESEGARQIQALREEKERSLNQVLSDMKSAQEDVLRWIGQRAIQVVSRKLAKETFDFIDEASLRGQIPSPYNEDFVKGLLKAETCICHRPLAPQSAEWNFVLELLKSAGNATVMRRIVQARARIQGYKDGAVEAPQALEDAQRKIANLVQRRNTLEQEIAELGNKLQNLPLTEIAERELARKALDEKIRSKYQDLAAEKQAIQLGEARKVELDAAIKQTAAKSEKARKFLRKRNLVTGAMEMLSAELEEYQKHARVVIQQMINNLLDTVARRDYKCRFDSDFSLKLLFADGTPTPKSGGENQLLSLSFIASLIKFSEIPDHRDGFAML